MIRIDKIREQLKLVPAIVSIAPGGIFNRLQETRDENYILISLVSDTRDYNFQAGGKSMTWRIEFRFIWWSSQTEPAPLLDMVDVVDQQILSNPCPPIFNYNGFVVFQVTEGTAFWPVITTELDRPVMIKDYLFSYFA